MDGNGAAEGIRRVAQAPPPAAETDSLEDQIRDIAGLAILNEIADFIAEHVVATRPQIDAMLLYAAATWGLQAFPAFGRMLWVAPDEQAGKTRGMEVTAALSANPVSAKGTVPSLQSELAAAQNEPEKPMPTLYYDEIGGVYGESGLNRGGNWVLDDVLRDGYRKGATRKWSVNRVAQHFSIYAPVLMTGRGPTIPKDIRSRTIVIHMTQGTPKRYFDERESRPAAAELAEALGAEVSSHMAELVAFRALGIHPKLKDRRLEVWEPLFAVAQVLGGQEWLNRCLAAFRELALAESNVVLTPRQKVIKDAAEVTAESDRKYVTGDGAEFMGGQVLVDELKRADLEREEKDQRYAGKSAAQIGQIVCGALPMGTVQVTVEGGARKRGYYVADILAAWEKIRPADPDDAELPEEADPFADDEDCTGSTGPAYVSAGQHGEHGEHEGVSS